MLIFLMNELKTFHIFIPKCANSKEIKDYSPISLCNLAYRILAKVLANHIKPFLDTITSKV